jgi:diadenosine tetraphosphate (Ap4A) HIT family hydrolase
MGDPSSSSGAWLHAGEGDCDFCQEAQTGLVSEPVRGAYGVLSRLFFRGDHVVAFPTISPLRTGHSLIVPREHRTSLAQYSARTLDEIIEACHIVGERFGHAIWFEHGIGAGDIGGCGISHAHMHVLPTTTEEFSDTISSMVAEFAADLWSVDGGIRHGLQIIPPDKSYLIVGSSSADNTTVAKYDYISSQFMRRLFAQMFGIRVWDWRNYTAQKQFHETLIALGCLAEA